MRQNSAKKKNETAARERGRSPFLIRVQLCEERIKMQLTDQDTRVGVVLDRLRAHCPGYRIDGLFTYDGCEMEEQDKIVDLVDYGECVVVTSGRTPSERAASAVLSSFGIMSCLPRTCVVSMPPHISILSDYDVFGPCVVRQDLADNLSEIHLAINGDILDTVIVPVRLVNKTGDEGCGPTLACRGGLILDVMRRIAVTGGGPTGGVNTVEELHHWVRRQVGNLSSWCDLYTHICTPPPRKEWHEPAIGEGEEGELIPANANACEDENPYVWTSNVCMNEKAPLPPIEKGQRLVVCTKSYPLTITADVWPSWKRSPLNLTGPERLQVGDIIMLDDPVRHEETTVLLKAQMKPYPWIRRMQRCVTETWQGAILFNDEVHFKDVTHSHPPSATSAGRLALKVVPTRAKRSMELGHNAEAEGLRNYRTWDDESVWAALPPHAHVLPLLFTAGPQLLFCPYMDAAPVTQWLLACPVQALDPQEMVLVYRAIMLQVALALSHFHDHGALHLGVHPENLQVRALSDMRRPVWRRMHVLLSDFSLTAVEYMAGSLGKGVHRCGVPGYWAPEQVPLEHPGYNDRWSHSPPELRLAFEMFIENVYAERDRDASCSKEAPDAARCRLRPPDFPRLSHSAWSWFTRDNRAESSTGCAESPADASRKEKEQNLEELPNLFRNASNAGDLGNSRGPAAHTRCTMQQVSDELQQVVEDEDEAARRGAWRDAVQYAWRECVVAEAADSFSLAMTMLQLMGLAIRARANSAEAKAHRLRAAAAAGCSTGNGASSCGASHSRAHPSLATGSAGAAQATQIAALSINEQVATEWQCAMRDELAVVLGDSLRLRPAERALASKISWQLQTYPAYAKELCMRMSGNDAPAFKPRYSDDALLDMPALLEQARARVYVCTTLLGADDPQTQRAQAALLHVLITLQAQVLGDMSVKAASVSSPFDFSVTGQQLLQTSDNLVEWFHSKGPPSIIAWHNKHGADAHANAIPPLPTLQDYRVAEMHVEEVEEVEAQPGQRTSAYAVYEQCCYVRAVYQRALVGEFYGRKIEALAMLRMLLQYIHCNIGPHHLLSFLPTLQAMRLEAEAADSQELREKLAAQRAWTASLFLFHKEASYVERLNAISSEMLQTFNLWQFVLDLYKDMFQPNIAAANFMAGREPFALLTTGSHDHCLAMAFTIRGRISYPYTYPSPSTVMVAMAHCMVDLKAGSALVHSAGAKCHHSSAALYREHERRTRAYQLVLAAQEYCKDTAGSTNVWRLHAPLSLAVKLCKIGTETGPLLSQALVFSMLNVELLVESEVAGPLPTHTHAKASTSTHSPIHTNSHTYTVKARTDTRHYGLPDLRSAGVGGGGQGEVQGAAHHSERYINIYDKLCDTDLANAYVALAEVERSVGMTSEAGAHFTKAGDILLKHEGTSPATAPCLESRGAPSGYAESTAGSMTELEKARAVYHEKLLADKQLASGGRGGGAAGAASFTCAAPGCVKTGLFQCSNCKMVRYCSVDCQRGDWKRHKASCKQKDKN